MKNMAALGPPFLPRAGSSSLLDIYMMQFWPEGAQCVRSRIKEKTAHLELTYKNVAQRS